MRKKLVLFILSLFLVSSSVKFGEVRAGTLSGTVTSIDGRELSISITYEGGREADARFLMKTILEVFPVLEDLWGFPYPYKSINVETFYEGPKGGWITTAQNSMGTYRFNTHPVAGLDRQTIIHEMNHSWHYGPKGTNVSAGTGTLEGRWFTEASSEGYAYLVLSILGADEEAEGVLTGRAWEFNEFFRYDAPLTKIGYQYGNTPEEMNKQGFFYAKSTYFGVRLFTTVDKAAMKRVWKRVFEKTPVKTEDFTKMVEEESGQDLDWLWSGWLYAGAYKDPWWLDWRENLPKKIEKVEGDVDSLKQTASDNELSIAKIEKNLADAKKWLRWIKIEKVREILDGLESDIANASGFISSYKELNDLTNENKELLDTYSQDLNIQKRSDTIKMLFNGGKFQDALSEARRLASDIQGIVDAVTSAKKTQENIRSFVQTSKPQFEKENLSIAPIEAKLSELESAISGKDFTSVASLAGEIESMIGQAKEALAAYTEARQANDAKGMFSADSSDILAQAGDEFNKGNYDQCIALARQAQEKNAQTNMTPIVVIGAVVLIAVGAAVFIVSRRKKGQAEAEAPAKENDSG